MKILQVVEPGVDGVFRHVEGLTDYLLGQGHQVCLAYSDCRGSDRLLQLVERVERAGGETLNLRVRNAPQWGDVRAFYQLWRFISETRPQVAHAHSSKAGVLLRAVAALRGVPAFYTPNAYYQMGGHRGRKAYAFNLIELVFGKIGKTINVSKDEAEFARKVLHIPANRQVVIPNAVDVKLFASAGPEQRAAWRVEHGLPADAIVLGTLGRLCDQKDPVTLYRAFAKVASENPSLYLAHVGKGELENECAAEIQRLGIEGRVLRIGYLSRPASFYEVLDGFVLSSRYEGLSFAVLEALASGVPLILTDVPGNRDFLRLGLSHTWSSPATQPEKLAAAIREWLSDRASDRPCNHHFLAETKFSFEVCYGKIVELYDEAPVRSRREMDPKGAVSVTAPSGKRRIRLATVSEPGIAGVKTHVMDILQNIDTARFDVHYYYSLLRSDQTFLDEIAALEARGIVCREIPMAVELNPWRDLIAFVHLYRALDSFRPDLLHLHSSKASGLGRFAAPLLWPRPRVIYTPNAMACYRSRLYLMVERALGYLTDVLVAVSASEKKDFVRWKIPHAEEAALISVGVRKAPPFPPPEKSAHWTIGACGRICYQKNALLFFRTALAMIGNDPTLQFRWIGSFADDDEAAAVRELLDAAKNPPQITITGWAPDPHREMSRLDTFCMFSRYESFGYVTADAMLLGVPVVALASTGTKDLIIHEETGLITDSDELHVAGDLLRLRDDMALRERLRVRAREHIEQNHTIQRMVRQMEDLYTRAARGSNGTKLIPERKVQEIHEIH